MHIVQYSRSLKQSIDMSSIDNVLAFNREYVATIAHHPLIPSDVLVRGFIIDSVTGELTEVL